MKEYSGLVFYSLGIVTTDKVEGSDYIDVFPIEKMFLTDGKISDYKNPITASFEDSKGKAKSANIEEVRTLTAKWVPGDASNRVTAPDVYKNETVKIYTYADTDKYYWSTLFREPLIRRQETVHYAFSNQPKGLVEYDKDTSYWFEVSTRHKYIQLKTAKNDKEPFIYNIKIDTKAGDVTIEDDIGNKIYLNSEEHRLKLINASGSFFDMHKEILDIYTGQEINMTSKAIKMTAETILRETSVSDTSNSPVHNLTSSNSYSSQAGTTSISSSGTTSVTGSFVNISASIGASVSGGVSISVSSPTGGMTSDGDGFGIKSPTFNLEADSSKSSIGVSNETIGSSTQNIANSTQNIGDLNLNVTSMNIPGPIDTFVGDKINTTVPGMIEAAK